ncbi:MAG: hypothetical protein GDA39_00500, partial [Hyphomonadaceae bacterium]|nr:hypothetical protein [Hyphomonadaceae bacterium]
EELEEQEGAYPLGGNIFAGPTGNWLPLYEGKMVQAYDHRAASVEVNPKNRHRPAQPVPATAEQQTDPDWVPAPQYWVNTNELTDAPGFSWCMSYKMITAPTNMRTMIAAALPRCGVGNSMGVLLPEKDKRLFQSVADLMLANINSVPFDFVIRQKVQGQNINWFIVEQLPVIPPERFDKVRFGPKTAAEIVRAAVLELTYTAHDMAPFARDMGHVDDSGNVRPPFTWDPERRLALRAKLDALFFHLYGITDRDDIRYIYSTFPIIKREETAAYGRYRSRELCLAWMNALVANTPTQTSDYEPHQHHPQSGPPPPWPHARRDPAGTHIR